MSRRHALAAALAFALVFAAPAVAGASDLVLQSVNASGFPGVELIIALPASMAGGETPSFTVTENGVKRPTELVEPVSASSREPIDVVLVLDTSGSMKGAPMRAATEAADEFIRAMGPRDRIAVIAFSEESERLSGFTSDRSQLASALSKLKAGGETGLYDALLDASKLIGTSSAGQRYVVLLSDGGDSVSVTSLDSAIKGLQDVGAPVYAIALTSPDYDPEAVRAVARSTQGKMLSAKQSDLLTDLFAGIAEEIQGTWRVVYTSAKPDSPDLEVSVRAIDGEEQASVITVLDNPEFKSGGEALAAKSLGTLFAAGAWNIGVAAGLAVGLGVLGLALLLRKEGPAVDQLDYYRTLRQSEVAPGESQNAGQAGIRAKLRGAVDQVAGDRGFSADLKVRIERAGLKIRPNELIYFHLLSVVVAGVVVQIAFRQPFISAVVVMIGACVPFLYLNSKASRRRARFEEQLPDVITLIAGSLRAGWGLQQALELIVQDTAEPAAGEFARVQSETRLGLPLEESLSRMANRLDSPDFHWVVSAIGIQREVGGNLAEVLDITAGTIRERAELRREVSALTAEGRFSGIILVLLPFFLFGAMMFVSPKYLSSMTGSPLGWVAFAMTGVLLTLGSFWLYRITKVEV